MSLYLFLNSLKTAIIAQKYSTIDAIFRKHYFQIENKVESEKQVGVSTVSTNPILWADSNMRWDLPEQCCVHQIIW